MKVVTPVTFSIFISIDCILSINTIYVRDTVGNDMQKFSRPLITLYVLHENITKDQSVENFEIHT